MHTDVFVSFPMLLLNLGLYVNQFVKVSNQSSISSYAGRDRDSGGLVLGDLRGRQSLFMCSR